MFFLPVLGHARGPSDAQPGGTPRLRIRYRASVSRTHPIGRREQNSTGVAHPAKVSANRTSRKGWSARHPSGAGPYSFIPGAFEAPHTGQCDHERIETDAGDSEPAPDRDSSSPGATCRDFWARRSDRQILPNTAPRVTPTASAMSCAE